MEYHLINSLSISVSVGRLTLTPGSRHALARVGALSYFCAFCRLTITTITNEQQVVWCVLKPIRMCFKIGGQERACVFAAGSRKT